MTRHVTGLSGGGGSWLTACVVQRELVRPGDEHTLYFSDVLYEDADAYRFLIEGALHVFGRKANWIPVAEDFPDYRVPLDALDIATYAGAPAWREFLRQLRERAVEAIPEMVWDVEGRDPWEVFRDERFLGNSGVDPCSKILKRRAFIRWLTDACDPANTAIYYGIGSGEAHRYDGVDPKSKNPVGIRPRMAGLGWRAEAPLIGRIEGELRSTLYMAKAGIRAPRLYAWADHNNCGGMCCKAGIKHWSKRLEVEPERFAYDAAMERAFQQWLGSFVTFLEDRRGGQRRPMSLVQLAERRGVDIEELIDAEVVALGERNGCGCMIEGDL